MLTSWRRDQCRCRWPCPCRERCREQRVFQWHTPWTLSACPAYPETLFITLRLGSNFKPCNVYLYSLFMILSFTWVLWCQVFCRWFVQSHGWQIGKKKIEGKRDNGQKHSENWFAAQTTKWYKSKCRFTHFGTKNPKVKWPLDTKSPIFIWMPKVKRLAHLWVPNVVHRKS